MRANMLLIVSALAGGLAGAAGTYLALREAGAVSERSAAHGPGAADTGFARMAAALFSRDAAASDVRPMATPDRLALYELAASSGAPDELESLIQHAAALPPSPRRSFELDALLMRLAEDDAGRAVELAHALRLETEFLAPLFHVWAEREPRAALTALGRIDNPAAVRAIALALLDVFGDDERGLAQLDSVFSAAQRRAFRVDALVRRAESAPFDALQEALMLPGMTARSAAISRIASHWAQRDPAAALAQVDAIPDEQARVAYRNAVIAEWARIDPDAVLAYLRTTATDRSSISVVLPALQSVAAAVEPDALLELAAELPTTMRPFARQMALQALAERDPRAAIDALESIASPLEQDQLRSAVAGAYARSDPDGALEWVRSLRPESLSAMASALSSIAATDPERAIDLILADDMQSNAASLAAMSVFSQLRDGNQLAAVADRLLARDDFSAPNQVRALVATWSAQDPHGALEWIVANAHRVDRGTVQTIAAGLASRDPEGAVRALDRLPPELRRDWLAQVAGGYAEHDPEAAVAWVMQYQGQPGFDQAVATITQRAAITNPQTALRLTERLGRPIDPQLAMQIAAGWASQEPAAAADWAMRLPAATRATAINAVAASWSARDPDAAKRWVLDLPNGQVRDAALGTLLPSTLLAGGADDSTIMNAFSSDLARQGAIARAVNAVAFRNRDDARRLVDTWITDPALRQQALDSIDNGGVAAPALFSPGRAISVRIP